MSGPVGRHSPTLPGFGAFEDLAGGRGLVLLRRDEAAVFEDSVDGVSARRPWPYFFPASTGFRSHAASASM